MLALDVAHSVTAAFVSGPFGTRFALVQLVTVLPLGRTVETGNAKHWLLGGFAITSRRAHAEATAVDRCTPGD